MKNIFRLLFAVLALCALAFNAVAQSQPTHEPRSFLKGAYLLSATSNTVGYGNTNIYAMQARYGTNVTWYTNAAGISDVPLWVNNDGTAPLVNLNLHIDGAAATDTNTWTIVVAGCPFAGVVATDAMNKWTTSIIANGTTAVALSTNVPARVVQGMHSVRLLSATPSSGSVTNTYFHGAALTGGSP